MNADLVPILNGLRDLPWVFIGQWVLVTLAVFVLVKALRNAPVVGRLARTIEELFFTNWQLALLATTGLVLSVASGYTTWDGMRNFTGEPLLSGMITFGIQGVMLIVAWLIGESFAVGMSQRASDGSARRAVDAWVGGVLGLGLAVLVFYWLLRQFDASILPGASTAQIGRFSDVAMYFAMGLIVLFVLLLNRTGDLTMPYVQSMRVIVKNSVLWLMFLACMATSVFFSFDSLFSAIFPAEERKRAADIRAVNQVAGVVSDIGGRIQARQADEAQRLFDTDGWHEYERNIDLAIKIASDSPRLIREQIARELEEQRSRVAALEEKKANAQSGAAGLSTRKQALSEELGRLTGERPEVVTQVQSHKTVIGEIERRLDEQRARTLAEEKGVEGSGKAGQGQFWRAAKAEEVKVQAELQVARERLRPAEARLVAVDRRLATIRSELAQIDGDLAKLRGESDTASQMISVTQSAKSTEQPSIDPASGVAALERARQAFRQKPEQATLAAIQSQCTALLSVASRVNSLKDEVARVDCEPRQASEAAGRVFALNAGLATFAQNCAGGDRLPQTGGTDALLQFGRRCLQDSGLPGKDAGELAGRLSTLDLNRDDKAHRFVVTWNAFQDGNRLAYLALAIAIAIDSLVFMSGLFGANAVRSPLSDVPSHKARSASQLEDIIDTALLPHTFDTARHVLGAMRPMTPRDGYMARIVIDEHDPHASDLRRVLNAGATIGTVRHVDQHDHAYDIRAELFEYLSSVTKREFEANREHVNLAELERTISTALLPDIAHGAETVLHYMHPIQETTSFKEWFSGPHGFTAEIVMGEVAAADQPIVRRALNAGSTLQLVQRRDQDRQSYYFIKSDLYKTLVRIRARMMSSSSGRAQIAARSAPVNGGALDADRPALAADAAPRLPAPARPTPPAPPADRPFAVDQQAAERPAARPPQPYQPRMRAVAEAAPVAAGAPDLQRLYNSFVTRMLAEAEFDPGAFALVARPDLHDAAVDAGKAMDTLKEAAAKLGPEVSRRERHVEQLIDRAFEALLADHRGDGEAEEALQQAYRDVASSVPAMMLAPRGAFEGIVGRMIRELEDAAAPDNGHREIDHQLLIRLRTLRSSLQMLDRLTPESWEQVGNIVFAYDETPTALAMPRFAAGH